MNFGVIFHNGNVLSLSTVICEFKQPLHVHEFLKQVMDAKWKFASTYSVGSAATIEERMPVWYLMDEFGSRIQHSDDFNFRLVLHKVSFCEFLSGFG